jgi:hypothetical protein
MVPSNRQELRKNMLMKQSQTTTPSNIVKSLQQLCVRAIDKQYMKDKAFIKSSVYDKALMCENPAFIKIDNMFYWLEWNRNMFIKNDHRMDMLVTDRTPSLPRCRKLITVKATSSCVPNNRRQIRIPSNSAISNLKVCGTGWQYATLLLGGNVLSVAIEGISNTFDMFENEQGCLPFTEYSYLEIVSSADVKYNISCIDPFNTDALAVYSVKRIIEIPSTININTRTLCSMIELRSNVPVEDPYLEIKNTCINIASTALTVSTDTTDTTDAITIPFIKHLGNWKLEFEHPIMLTGEISLKYYDMQTLVDTVNISVYAHCIDALIISDKSMFLKNTAILATTE